MGRYASEPDNATKSAKAKVFKIKSVKGLKLLLFSLCTTWNLGFQLEGSLQEHSWDSPSYQGENYLGKNNLPFQGMPLHRATKYLKNVIAQKEIIPFR